MRTGNVDDIKKNIAFILLCIPFSASIQFVREHFPFHLVSMWSVLFGLFDCWFECATVNEEDFSRNQRINK